MTAKTQRIVWFAVESPAVREAPKQRRVKAKPT